MVNIFFFFLNVKLTPWLRLSWLQSYLLLCLSLSLSPPHWAVRPAWSSHCNESQTVIIHVVILSLSSLMFKPSGGERGNSFNCFVRSAALSLAPVVFKVFNKNHELPNKLELQSQCCLSQNAPNCFIVIVELMKFNCTLMLDYTAAMWAC